MHNITGQHVSTDKILLKTDLWELLLIVKIWMINFFIFPFCYFMIDLYIFRSMYACYDAITFDFHLKLCFIWPSKQEKPNCNKFVIL